MLHRDIPAYPQSAMDGYAFRFKDFEIGNAITIIGEVQAGVVKIFQHHFNKAVRIFTGAQVPDGFDTVVMQEKVQVQHGQLLIEDENLKQGSNVRPAGSEIRKSELALPANSLLSPAAVGFLAGIGVSQVKAFVKPSISIIITGKELQKPGQPLQPGNVYESNSVMLKAALQQSGNQCLNVIVVDDDVSLLTEALANALQDADMVLLTGGVSVGDYDFVLEASTRCGVQKHFHRVKQKPGKPLYFGTFEDRIVFGLPGNPSSVLTCFYEYVLPAIKMLSGSDSDIEKRFLPIGSPTSKKAGLTHFLKGQIISETVNLLPAQESYKLSSFATANCLIILSEETENVQQGDVVEVHILP